MKYIKKYESSNHSESNKNWSPLTIELFEKLSKLTGEDYQIDEYVKKDFDDLDDELIDSESYELYQVYYTPDNDNDITYAICRAYGPIHASVLTAIHYSEAELFESLQATLITEEQIDLQIDMIDKQRKIWTDILNDY